MATGTNLNDKPDYVDGVATDHGPSPAQIAHNDQTQAEVADLENRFGKPAIPDSDRNTNAGDGGLARQFGAPAINGKEEDAGLSSGFGGAATPEAAKLAKMIPGA